jgi:Domain of Unknown Function (DUF1259)
MTATRIIAAAFAAAVWTAATTAAPASAEPAWDKVAQALGKSGAVVAGGVYRIGLPRTDLRVTLDGVELKPGFALGSWLAFEPTGDQAMVMGDLVLTESEVSPVMQKLAEHGFEITALHNHLLRGSPTTLYMHVLGHGDPVALATSLHEALAFSKTPFTAPAPPASPTPPIELDTAALDQILGAKGSINGGVYQVGVPRGEKITETGMAVPPSMGSAIAINFQPTGGDKAAITGDFVLLAKEVNPVLQALRAGGIEVTALHSHMLNEEPRLFFMHFWANDDAAKLAKALRAALDRINVAHG